MFIFRTANSKVHLKLAAEPSLWKGSVDRPTGYLNVVDSEDYLQYKYYFKIETAKPLSAGETVDFKGLLNEFQERMVETLETETGRPLYSESYIVADYFLRSPVCDDAQFINGVRYINMGTFTRPPEIREVNRGRIMLWVKGTLFGVDDIYLHPDFYEFSGPFGKSILAQIQRLRSLEGNQKATDFIVDTVASMLDTEAFSTHPETGKPYAVAMSVGLGDYMYWDYLC